MPPHVQSAAEEVPVTWSQVRQALTRPYRVTASMVLLVCYVPFYIFIAERASAGPVHVPALPVDDLIPLVPAWSLVYGALYLFLIVLPVVVIQQEDLVRRAVRAWLAVWTLGYLAFLAYPTVAPRPDQVLGSGFAAWGVRFLYDSDPPYNCLPSLHVAHTFVSALVCGRVNRKLGWFALFCAALVAVSTLFTRQHYVVDVVAGAALAAGAVAVFLRGAPPVAALERRVAPALAGVVGLGVGVVFLGFWVGYLLTG